MLLSVKHKIHTKLVLVVIIIPTICNSIQFWITDNIIKKDEILLSAEIKKDEEKNLKKETNQS